MTEPKVYDWRVTVEVRGPRLDDWRAISSRWTACQRDPSDADREKLDAIAREAHAKILALLEGSDD